MSPTSIVRKIQKLKFPNTFNPYSDRCEIYDYFEAPKLRREILIRAIEAAKDAELDSFWVGRDLGFRGGRRTGLPFTDDLHLQEHAKRWGFEPRKSPTKGEALAERSGSIIWTMLSQISDPVFIWNVFPLHPHESGKPLSNRAHNAEERKAGEEILCLLVDYLKPKRIIAIGNDADKSANRILQEVPVIKVRHPSYGGQNIFISQIKELYRLK